MHRWTARFVVLVMLVPVIGPLALARMAPMEGMHCVRQPLAAAAATPAAEPAMHCHEGAPRSAEQSEQQSAVSSASTEASFRSLDCCRNHDCCRSVTTSEWAQAVGRHYSYVRLLIEPAVPALAAARVSSPLIGADSARAPPRS
jgi:hypothetical protein